MADLDAQIRVKLTEMRHNAQKRGIDADEERDERLDRVAGDAETLADIVLAVLDLHPAEQHTCMIDGAEGTAAQGWYTRQIPCPTQEAVAGKLGIEIPNWLVDRGKR